MSYTIAETFVGCGGAHFGFKKSGFETIFVNDIWEDAINTLILNDKNIDINKVICEDINNLNEEILKNRNINYDNIDVLLGGVVCKGFSLAGIRNPYDERNYLYKQQLRLVKLLKPKISIIENVPAMLNMKILKKTNDISVNELCLQLNNICEEHKKYRGKLISLKKKINFNIHNKILNNDINTLENKIKFLKNKRKELEKILDVHKYSVVEDIEKIYKELGYTVYKKILTCSDYNCFTNRKRLFIVATRNDLNMKWSYPLPVTNLNKPTVKDAFKLLDKNINNPENDKDNCPMKHRKNTIEKFKNIKSDIKSKDGYFSRGTSSRLSYDKPAPTLVPGHSSFQIHPIEHRSITVREGALITGFDNTFKFYGSHTSRCMQIGNAIPVNMAYYLAEHCKKILNNINI